MEEDTIAAISTPEGAGGIAVIRISGPLAEEMSRRLFRAQTPIRFLRSRHLYYGDIVHPETGAVLDEGMICLMRGPRSYTGEDVLEIHCHGGILLPRTILAAALKIGGRPAEAGEFTRRAFLNGRIDLSQAEAISDVISAQTEEALGAALSQMKGGLRRTVEAWIDVMTAILAELEATIDFAEDVEALSVPVDLSARLRALSDDFHRLAATYGRGRILRQGASVVIVGRPNVGKSSLLNRLLGEKRAIVTAIPGTTRDFIEESIDIFGVPIRLTDTAGVRAAENAIEQAGIDLVWERVAEADAVVALLDGSEALTRADLDILAKIRGKPIIPAINKSDLPRVLEEDALAQAVQRSPVLVSAKYDRGIDELKTAIHRCVGGGENGTAGGPGLIITTLRHRLAMEKAALFLSQGAESAAKGRSPELIAADLRDALDCLQEIGGRIVPDDILDRIFTSFCIGK